MNHVKIAPIGADYLRTAEFGFHGQGPNRGRDPTISDQWPGCVSQRRRRDGIHSYGGPASTAQRSACPCERGIDVTQRPVAPPRYQFRNVDEREAERFHIADKSSGANVFFMTLGDRDF